MTTIDADSDIWVHDYTTATGVQVAGHWRKRRAGTAAADDDSPAHHPDAVEVKETPQISTPTAPPMASPASVVAPSAGAGISWHVVSSYYGRHSPLGGR